VRLGVGGGQCAAVETLHKGPKEQIRHNHEAKIEIKIG